MNIKLNVKPNQEVYAPISGHVKWNNDNEVEINNKVERMTISGIAKPKINDKDIKRGDIISFCSDSILKLSFQKKIEGKWVHLNPGFYLNNIVYQQKTYTKTISNFSSSKVFMIYQKIKSILPNATTEGVAAMLGNFEIESGIEPKRAEGDYLSPPIGATDSSWNDPNWLSMTGPQIYNGLYPNILKRGLGLGQWTDTADGSVRHTMLLNFAKNKAKDWYDLDLQIDFILSGDHVFYQTIAKSILCSDEKVEVLTKKFLQMWEGNSGDKLLERQEAALRNFEELNQPQVTTNPVSTWDFPEEYRSKLVFPFPSQTCVSPGYDNSGSYYPQGQCTFYVYNRVKEVHHISVPMSLGNGQDWVGNLVNVGWHFCSKPVVGAVVSTRGGFDYTYPQYGHVMFVEYVNPDGSFLVSELNVSGVQDRVHWRVCFPNDFYTFALPPK